MWIHAIFVFQLIGSVVVMEVCSVGYRQVTVPLGLLLLGAVSALGFKRSFDPRRPYVWERWLPAAIYAGFIFAMSSRSYPGANLPVSSNAFHPFEYAFLSIFLCWALYPVLAGGKAVRFGLLVVACATLYGMSDEIHQYFVPGRSCSLEDLALDFLGACSGLALFLLVRRNSGVLDSPPSEQEM